MRHFLNSKLDIQSYLISFKLKFQKTFFYSRSGFQQRIFHIYLLISCSLSVIAGRMTFIQVIQSKQLELIAQTMQTQRIEPLGKLRRVVDRAGRLLAFDEERFNVAIQTRYFDIPGHKFNVNLISSDEKLAIASLSECLGVSSSELIRQLKIKPSGIRIASGLDLDIVRYFYELRGSSKGLWVKHYIKRVYPEKATLANVIGFVNLGRIPQSGVENSRAMDIRNYEKTLAFRQSGDGTTLPNDLKSDSLYSDDFCLEITIDTRLQQVASRALIKQMNKWDAKRGVAMVMDVRNGELLALASFPTYDPNRYWKYSSILYREWSVQDTSEPGSTFKPINLALALQGKAIEPHGKVNDVGALNISGWPILNHDHNENGLINFPRLLQVSSNIGMITAMSGIPLPFYWKWLDSIVKKPNTDLFEPVTGQVKSKEDFLNKSIEPAAVAFGQGFSLSPLRLIQLHAMLANGGRLITPRITRGVEFNGGTQIIDPAISRTLLRWMETVVEEGSGQIVSIPGYRIGGKTGTAQKAQRGQYSLETRVCSFVAHLPINNPQFAILVVVDEPKGKNAYGATVAGPVVKEIIETLLVFEKILPTEEIKLDT
uniref:Putative peptidoglycan synthetase (Pbp transpeptidase domain) n=1 Tax=Paulinella chromatophora TaxID=39717 RepID=B1X5S7_PAUCH|nr:putative peptidoglycan synthetase (pbp transpeptidase domain) [Paulinella chromatophora]ACB43296.1 putative peptidoglycan synthetase (pbp transpeptidase domain) [Paulinella chromatophora]